MLRGTKDTVLELLACIDSQDRDVADDAVSHTPDYLAYSGEFSAALITRVFHRGPSAVSQLRKLCKFSLEQ